MSQSQITDALTFLGNPTTGGFLQFATNTLNGITDPTTGVIATETQSLQNPEHRIKQANHRRSNPVSPSFRQICKRRWRRPTRSSRPAATKYLLAGSVPVRHQQQSQCHQRRINFARELRSALWAATIFGRGELAANMPTRLHELLGKPCRTATRVDLSIPNASP